MRVRTLHVYLFECTLYMCSSEATANQPIWGSMSVSVLSSGQMILRQIQNHWLCTGYAIQYYHYYSYYKYIYTREIQYLWLTFAMYIVDIFTAGTKADRGVLNLFINMYDTFVSYKVLKEYSYRYSVISVNHNCSNFFLANQQPRIVLSIHILKSKYLGLSMSCYFI